MAYGREDADDTTDFLDFVHRIANHHKKYARMTKSERKDHPKNTMNLTSGTRPLRQPWFNKNSSTPTSVTSQNTRPATSIKETAPKLGRSGWNDMEE